MSKSYRAIAILSVIAGSSIFWLSQHAPLPQASPERFGRFGTPRDGSSAAADQTRLSAAGQLRRRPRSGGSPLATRPDARTRADRSLAEGDRSQQRAAPAVP